MSVIKNFLFFLLSFFIAFLIWSIIKLYLPNIPTTFIPVKETNNFYHIKLTNIFSTNKNNQKEIKKIQDIQINSLDNIILKGIYNSQKKAFIIIQDKQKTVFIDLNKTYNGYKLIQINSDSAIFIKNNKKYILTFEKEKKLKKVSESTKIQVKKLTKKTLLEYKNSLSKVWNNIGIIKSKRGYKITYIKKNSIFDKMGLKKGDILIKVNNQKLSNDAQAWKLYNNVEKYDNFEIEILRNNELKVLNYEIY
jgi:general secretion pathway protein C